jgi:hypothetical protein
LEQPDDATVRLETGEVFTMKAAKDELLRCMRPNAKVSGVPPQD